MGVTINEKKKIDDAKVTISGSADFIRQAAIAENGLWTDNDWYDDDYKIGV